MSHSTEPQADPVAEQLSAFLDGELPEREVDLLLKRLNRDSGLRQSLGRYAAIGETLRGAPAVAAVSGGFADRVCATLDRERAAVEASVQFRMKAGRWIRKTARGAVGMAIAAGVAGLAIVLLQQQALIPGASAPESLRANTVPGGTVLIGSAEPPSYTVTLPATTNPVLSATRLTDYVIAHSEYSSPLGRRSMLSGAIAEDPMPVEAMDNPLTPATTLLPADTAHSLPVSVPVSAPAATPESGAPAVFPAMEAPSP